MKDIIAIANQKGGVAKTTTAFQVGSFLADEGERVLLVDLDGQCDLTKLAGADRELLSSWHLLDKQIKAPIKDTIQRIGNMDFIAGNKNLYAIQLPQLNRYKQVEKALKPILCDYDYIILDTPPDLSDMLINALAVATKVIVPARPDSFSLDALICLAETIDEVKEELNSSLEVAGILITQAPKRANITQAYIKEFEEACQVLKTKLFSSVIGFSVVSTESITYKESVFKYNKNSGIAQDYKAFCEELIASLNN